MNSRDSHKVVFLIERGQAEHQSPTIWWRGGGFASGLEYGGQWTEIADRALKFDSRDEAEALAKIKVHRFYRVTEHLFLDPQVDGS